MTVSKFLSHVKLVETCRLAFTLSSTLAYSSDTWYDRLTIALDHHYVSSQSPRRFLQRDTLRSSLHGRMCILSSPNKCSNQHTQPRSADCNTSF